eukprot:1827759-Alexandrium_andersonii.AAC.1
MSQEQRLPHCSKKGSPSTSLMRQTFQERNCQAAFAWEAEEPFVEAFPERPPLVGAAEEEAAVSCARGACRSE